MIHNQSRLTVFRRKHLAWRHEPSLDEMLAEPIVQTMMARDRVTRGELVALLTSVKPAVSQSVPELEVA